MNGLRTAPSWVPTAVVTLSQTTDCCEPGMLPRVTTSRPVAWSGMPLPAASSVGRAPRHSPAVTT
jgi:hypothetical protein